MGKGRHCRDARTAPRFAEEAALSEFEASIWAAIANRGDTIEVEFCILKATSRRYLDRVQLMSLMGLHE